MFGQAEAAAFNVTSRNASQNATIELAVQRAALSAYSPEGSLNRVEAGRLMVHFSVPTDKHEKHLAQDALL
ncbi:unnamed protein product [Rangifer tarandus platyrhynchus]|uniref:Uncharacterized protein n=1 Tax=Rangifer tarandus platyrhynchus TaxID=3082113 RepID=A0AC59Z4N4_RANTA